MSNTTPLKFWQGTNFWAALFLFVFGIFAVTVEYEVGQIVGYVFGLFGAIMAVREKLKGAQVDWKRWAGSKNTWNYLATVIVAIVPGIPLELFEHLATLAQSLLGGNWQGALVALFSIGTILFYLLNKPKQVAA
jgi:ABC-type xylose transport system permease subunit